MNKLNITTIAIGALFVPALSAQGLLSIGGNDDFGDIPPLTITVGVGAGWDSNINTSREDEVDSIWYRVGAGLSYGWNNRITQATLGLAGSAIYYEESGPRDNEDYNARLTFNIKHSASPRLTFTDSMYIAYEAEPDFAVGVAAARRSGQYFYVNNNFGATYALSRRSSINLGYNIGAIFYDEDDASASEDRVTHNVSLNYQYALSKRTVGVIGARWGTTVYDTLDADFDTYSAYIGADHSFSPRLTGSVRVGATRYENSARDFDDTAPFLEGSLNYALDRSTAIRWYNRLGYEGSELSSFDSRYSYRTGISARRQLDRRTSLSAGVHYAHSELDGSEELGDISEDQLYFDLGLGYRIYKNIDFNAGYTFITLSSDSDNREYDRHRVSVGVSATF